MTAAPHQSGGWENSSGLPTIALVLAVATGLGLWQAGLQPSSRTAPADVHLDCQLDSHLTALNLIDGVVFCVLGH